jgi:hypothetical protein
LLGLGVTVVVITVTDEVGNYSTCAPTITVVDATPPEITCPAPLKLTAGTNGLATLPDLLPGVLATDNCGGVSLEQEPPAGSLIGLGLTEVMMIATDSSANSNSCTTSVTVQPAPATLDIAMYAGLTIGGSLGGTYSIEYTTNLHEPVIWLPLESVTLTNSSHLWFDVESANKATRYYRVLTP